MHSTLHLHIELYACMYFIACYFETVDMNCWYLFIWTKHWNLCNCEWTLMNINDIFDKQTSILVLCSSTVKEPAVFYSY